MEKILVTGGAGFIGSHVCERLLAQGKAVVCVDDMNDYYNPKIKEKNISVFSSNENFRFYKIDITDYEKLEKVFEENEIGKVIHIAARAGVRASMKSPELYHSVNVVGTKNLLELAVKFKIKNFIFGSSSSVYGTNKKTPFSEEDPIENIISPYAESKKQAEKLCREYHDKSQLNILCLRFFTVYGPRGRPDMAPYKFTKLITEEKPIEMYGDGNSMRDYTFVSDIVDGIISALDNELGFEIINLGDSKPVKLKEFISIIEKAVGKKAEIIQKPMPPGDVPMTYADISKAKRLLGYQPKISLENGIGLFTDWFKKNS